MKFEDYYKWVPTAWRSKGSAVRTLSGRDDFIMTLGLAGEVGEVLEIIKKNARANNESIENLEAFKEEMGDVMYYWHMLCYRHNVSPEEILDKNVDKINRRIALNQLTSVTRDKS